MAEPQANRAQGPLDYLTVAGVAALAYALSTQLHEAGGHGLSCLAVGGRWIDWGAYYVDCDSAARGPMAARIVEAAGSSVNLVVALLVWPALRATPASRPGLRLFLWLMLSLNLFNWAGYFLFSGVSGLGDWGDRGVFRGVRPAWAWRSGLSLVGAGLYLASAWVSARALARLVGSGPVARRQAYRLGWTAYAAGGLIAVLTGFLNPQGIVIVLISAAASSLGGTSGLIWLQNLMPRAPAGDAGERLFLPRSWPWIGAGALAAGLAAVVLGPTRTLDWRL